MSSSSARQGFPFSPFLFNFVIHIFSEITLSSSDFSQVDVLQVDSLNELEYTDDIDVFGEDAGKM